MSKVSVSVVTVTLNAVDCIKQAIESVVGQTYSNIEYLIIDGGSDDGTLDIVEKYNNEVDNLVSEPDEGLYNAMNKGISASTGDVLYFLNADDCFCDENVVADVASVFADDPALEWGYGNVLTETPIRTTRMQYPEFLTRKSLMLKGFCHQALFARRETFERTDGFDEQYSIAADLDWVLKCLVMGVKSKRLSRDITRFRHGGLSESKKWREESVSIRNKYFSPLEYFYWKKILKRIKKKNRGQVIQ